MNKKSKDSPESTRVSVTFPLEHYEKLQHLANKNRVSVAWVVRDAVDKYLKSEKQAKTK